MSVRMQPLRTLPRDRLRQVDAVLCDIDDTLTTDGLLTSDAYAALSRLAAAGLKVVPITGRPAGWCDHIGRMWPVAGIVGENGAFWMRYDAPARKLVKRFGLGEAERRANRARLTSIAERILERVPGAALASDQLYREADLAIDYCEDVPALPRASVDAIVAMMQAEGMTAKVSSIHVNGWFGHYDKLSMTRALFAEAFGIDLDVERGRFLYIGDSPNDAPMFEFFPLSVGVANVRAHLDRIATAPAYVTGAPAGAGFTELARFVLER